MVGIQGVGGILEPKSERPAKVREKETDVSQSTSTQDGVEISSEAQTASKVARAVTSSTEQDVRAERIAAAKERIDRGEYKNPDVVAKVAERVSKYLP
jgi:anti-sigma28 factor (negative regulator of flagellin synthesis)